MKSIQGVEIFAAGKWNGDEYSEADLDEMVRAFNENSATYKPPLKLGHDDNQELLQRDGYPAAGWIGRVYREGRKLFADFIDIPNKIYDLLEKGAYKKVSSEIYWDIEIDGNAYTRALAGVALLGADMPAVTCLDDIISMYGLKFDVKKICTTKQIGSNIKTHTFEREAQAMDDKNQELEAAQAKVNELQEKLTAYAESEKTKADEIETLKKFKEESEKKIGELEAEKTAKALEADVSILVSEKVISPAMKPYALELLGSEKKEYSLGDKKLSKLELVKAMFALHAEALKVNTEEKTVDGEKIPQSKQDHQKIEEYAAKNSVSYAAAYKAIMKDSK